MRNVPSALDIFEILFDEVWEFYKVQLEFSTQLYSTLENIVIQNMKFQGQAPDIELYWGTT